MLWIVIAIAGIIIWFINLLNAYTESDNSGMVLAGVFLVIETCALICFLSTWKG
jgi:hypothetical protein